MVRSEERPGWCDTCRGDYSLQNTKRERPTTLTPHHTNTQVGGERYNLFTGCPQARTATIVLRGGSEQFIDEAERSLHDAIMIVRCGRLGVGVRGCRRCVAVGGGGVGVVCVCFGSG